MVQFGHKLSLPHGFAPFTVKLLLLDLRISNGHYLGVQHHLIHVLHLRAEKVFTSLSTHSLAIAGLRPGGIIHVFIQHLLSPLQHTTLRPTGILQLQSVVTC